MSPVVMIRAAAFSQYLIPQRYLTLTSFGAVAVVIGVLAFSGGRGSTPHEYYSQSMPENLTSAAILPAPAGTSNEIANKTFTGKNRQDQAITRAPASVEPSLAPPPVASAEINPKAEAKVIDITSYAGMFAAGVFLLSFCVALLLLLIAFPCYLFANNEKTSKRSGTITKVCISYILGSGVASFSALGFGIIKPFWT